MNTKRHAVTDQNGQPLNFFMTAGQVSDYAGASALRNILPMAQWMLAARSYDADWFRDARRLLLSNLPRYNPHLLPMRSELRAGSPYV